MSHLQKRSLALRRFSLALAAEAEELCSELSVDLDLALGELRTEQLPAAMAAIGAWERPEAVDPAVRSGERRATGAIAIQVEARAALTDLCRVMPAAVMAGCPQVVVNLCPALQRTARRLATIAERCLPGVIFSAVEPAAFVQRTRLDPYCHALWVGGALPALEDQEAAVRASGQPLVWERAANDAVLLGAGGDLAAAVAAASTAFRLGGGERAGIGRVYVHQRLHDAFVEAICAEAAARAVEDPHDPEAMVSPLRSEADRAALLEMLDAAEDAGASLDVGLDFRRFGQEREPVLYPTVVSGCAPGLAIVTAVKPGPVLAVVPFADEAELCTMLGAPGGACATFGIGPTGLMAAARAFGRLCVGGGAAERGADEADRPSAPGPDDRLWWGNEVHRGPLSLQRVFTRVRAPVARALSAESPHAERASA